MKYRNKSKVRCPCNYLKNPESLEISTSVEEVKDINCSIQDPSVKFFHTSKGCDHACGIRKAAVPQIKPKITHVDVMGKSFI